MKKEDWKNVFGEPSASFDERFSRTLNHLEEKKNMKKHTVRILAAALMLALGLIGTAYAAANGFTLPEFISKVMGGHMPDDFASGYREDYTQEAGGLLFHIRDAYVNGNSLITLTEVTRADGKPALILPEDFDEGDLLSNLDFLIYPDREDGTTIGEYASSHQLPVVNAYSWFLDADGNPCSGMGNEWAEDDYRKLVFYSALDQAQAENGKVKIMWQVCACGDGLESESAQMEIEIPVEDFEEWEVEVNQSLAHAPVTVERLYLRQTRIDLQVDVEYCLDEERIEPGELLKTKQELFIDFIDPQTGKELPHGMRTGVFTTWLNEEGTALRQNISSIQADAVGDILTIRFWNPFIDADPDTEDIEPFVYDTLDVQIR